MINDEVKRIFQSFVHRVKSRLGIASPMAYWGISPPPVEKEEFAKLEKDLEEAVETITASLVSGEEAAMTIKSEIMAYIKVLDAKS